MSFSAFQLACLRDARLAPLAVSAMPAWLWSRDATQILWANPSGAAIFGAPTSAAIRTRKFDPEQPAAAQIARLVGTLPPDGTANERLRGFGAGVGRALACACSQISLADQTPAILIVATERAGPDLPFNERVHRLLAGNDEPVAAFSPEGKLLYATPAAHEVLRGATSLSALSAGAVASGALRSGHARGMASNGPIAIDRIGREAAMVLIVSFAVAPPSEQAAPANAAPTAHVPPGGQAAAADPATSGQSQAAALISTPPTVASATSAGAPEPAAANERRHPLRFVWQIDQEGRFTLGSDEFIALIGPRTAQCLGQRWPEIAAALALDPDGRVAEAVTTHDTWSGITVTWPVDDSAERLTVELSGLPVFDRERMFRGYRGFGVCRDLARLATLRELRRAAALPAAADEDFGTAKGERAAIAPVAANIVPFPAAAPEVGAPTLSAVERRAFHELSRKLTQRLAASSRDDDLVADQDGAVADTGTAAGIGAPEAKLPDAARAEASLADLAETANAMSKLVAGEEATAETDRTAGAIVSAKPLALSARDARAMFDGLPVGVLIYRLDQLLYANPAFLQWSGHDNLEELIQAGGLDSLFVEPGNAEAGKPLALTTDRGKKSRIEAELINLHWQDEAAHGLVSTTMLGHPKLQRTQAETEVAELNAILDAATDGFVMLDHAGQIHLASRGAEALLGELAGRTLPDLLMPESAQAICEDLRSLARGQRIMQGREIIARTRQGSLVPLFTTFTVLSGDRLGAAFRDLTRWKKSQTELAAALRQADQAATEKSDLLAKISHELRNPLNVIIGFCELMLEGRLGPLGNDRYREYVKDIHACGGDLLALLDDHLKLTRIESGKLAFTRDQVALNELIRQCITTMQPQANRERIIVRSSLPQELPAVLADAHAVRQIVLNLLANAIEFTGAGGQIIISTAREEPGEVLLRVRDSGPGMSEQEIATEFAPVHQIATTTRGGSTVRLPLVKALAQANGARFGIKSAPHSGTLVEIAFPAMRAAE